MGAGRVHGAAGVGCATPLACLVHPGVDGLRGRDGVDALTISGVVLGSIAGVRLWRARSMTLLLSAFYAVIFLTAIRALLTPAREDAFFRLLLLGGAWFVYRFVYQFHVHAERAMPYLAAAAIAFSARTLFVSGLPIGWLWDRNVTADVLLLLTPWLRGPVMLLGGVAVLLTGSRGAWLGAAAALLWLIARPRWYVWALLVGALAVGLVFIRPETALQRIDIWQSAARLYLERPLTGWGIGAITPVLWDGQVVNFLHAHNILLDALLNGGVFLGAAWALLLFAVIQLIVGPPGSRARLGLLAVLLHGLVDCEIWTPVILLMAVNLALLVRFRESENNNGLCTDSGCAATGTPVAA